MQDIVRQGITNNEIKKVERICSLKNITMKICSTNNEKELIEIIPTLKKCKEAW